MRIRLSELIHYLGLDPWYGYESGGGHSLLNELYREHENALRFTQFNQRYQLLPCKSEWVRELVYLWIVAMKLPAYDVGKDSIMSPGILPNEWRKDFEVDLEQLKRFMRDQQWPLPSYFFPDEWDNTERKATLEQEEYDLAWDDFVLILPELEEELSELQRIQPESMQARENKKREISIINKKIEAIYSGKKVQDRHPSEPTKADLSENLKDRIPKPYSNSDSFSSLSDSQISTSPESVKEFRKSKTKERHERWQSKVDELSEQHPDKSHRWICILISKDPIAEGSTAETIRRNTRINAKSRKIIGRKKKAPN